MNAPLPPAGAPLPAPSPRRRLAPYSGQTYYDRPSLKPAPWDWLVSGYIFLAGISGSAQIIAAAGQTMDGGRYAGMIRNARFLAAGGTALGAVFLVADLRTPQRWYNMLRIFRRTSPMSIGTYILCGFGGSTALTLLGELPGHGPAARAGRSVAAIAQYGAAATGAGAGTYTAALLAATSTPEWSAEPRKLGARFGISSIASGAAAMSIGERLGGRDGNAGRLDAIAAAASFAGAVVDALPASQPEPESRPVDVTHLVVGGAIPLAAYALASRRGGSSRALSIAGSLAVIAGAALLRHGVLKAGNRSAQRPRDYFELAQPRRERPGRRRHDRSRIGGE